MIETGIFSIRLPFVEGPTLAYATVEVNLVGDVVAEFTGWMADGFGSDLFGWHDGVFLRSDLARGVVELLVSIDDGSGEISVEASWELAGAALEHLAEVAAARDPSHGFALVRAITAPDLDIRPADDDLVARCAAMPGGARIVRSLVDKVGFEEL